MGLRINTNVQSLAAQRNLGVNTEAQKTSFEKLASGSRINKAADDAAGLAISEKMRATIRSVRQDVRNANDGISMIQTAEGGMNEVSNVLVRFRELSIQAASDTLGDQERSFIDKEMQQLKSEVNRIAAGTEFNGRKLLNGEGNALDIQIGTGNNAELDRFSYDPSKTAVGAEALGIAGLSTATKESSQQNLEQIDQAIMKLNENRAELGALQNRLGSAVTSLNIYDENLSGAKSRIADVDMANETAEMMKRNILTQAGTSVLSQANSSSQLALKLIG
jgi:flagellin